MKKTIKILVGVFILMSIIFQITTISYAQPVQVTKDNLLEAFKNFKESGDIEGEYSVLITDDKIKINVDEKTYEMNYDITDANTFSTEIIVSKGMSYEEFEDQISDLITPILGYMATATIQGATMDDAALHIMQYLFSSALLNTSSNSEYIIYDDINQTTTIENVDNKKVIYASEFGDHAIEYVNALFKDVEPITDIKEFNSFVWNIQQKEVTDTSCKIVSKLSVNTDADFTKLDKNLEDSIVGSITNSINGGNVINISNTVNNGGIYTNTSNVMNITNLPQTGEGFKVTDLLVTIIVVSIIGLVALHINKKKNYTE